MDPNVFLEPTEVAATTIAAPITAPGRAAVAVVRVSGPGAAAALEKLAKSAKSALSHPRQAILSDIFDCSKPQSTDVLDRALVTFFKAPASYTGEDSFEVAVHGSPFILERLMASLSAVGVELAAPGEFTQRAFLNGQMDLAQAEAVADVIAAETAAQAQVAREQLAGKLSSALAEIGEPLRDLLAEIEAHIDFPEEDIEPLSRQGWLKELKTRAETLSGYISSFDNGRLYREGAQVVLAGLPNAGKSSLLNCFVGEQRAIVTEIAGTTRDSIEERVSLGGVLVRFWDTAGLADETSIRELGKVERIGIERSWNHLQQADLVLYVIDGSVGIEDQKTALRQLSKLNKRVVVVINKVDLNLSTDLKTVDKLDILPESQLCFVSATSGQGISDLRQVITKTLVGEGLGSGQVVVSNRRHYEALLAAREAVAQAIEAISANQAAELVSADLRAALYALEEIIGLTPTEDILGRIFSKFCIGK